MLKEVKAENISALKLELAKAASLVITDFRGITVKNDTALRREFRANGCQYQVVKNTLLGKAVLGTPMAVIEAMLAGPTAIAYSYDEAVGRYVDRHTDRRLRRRSGDAGDRTSVGPAPYRRTASRAGRSQPFAFSRSWRLKAASASRHATMARWAWLMSHGSTRAESSIVSVPPYGPEPSSKPAWFL